MVEHDYVYRLRPLVVPAVFFLILYPVVVAIVFFLGSFPSLALGVLVGIYVVAALSLIFVLLVGKSERVKISDQHIVFRSLLGTKILKPQSIRRVAFYYDRKGQEVVQIRTDKDYFYLNDFYFPFPELMSDLEEFIHKYDLHYTVKRKNDFV